jgi:hypothetical protein
VTVAEQTDLKSGANSATHYQHAHPLPYHKGTKMYSFHLGVVAVYETKRSDYEAMSAGAMR